MRPDLPIDPHLPAIREQLRSRRAAVVVAEPGAGKTTRLPPALLEDGPLILLQPRRVAARALTRRIAAENGWTVGEEIGWQIRFERRFGKRTRLLVATEGVLTARLRSDPLLEAFRTVVLDEFHERSLHADLALALVRQAWLAREDLRVVVMSATLDASAVAGFLDDAPVIEVPGRSFPLTVDYAPALDVAEAVRSRLGEDRGHVLAFLPGAREIDRAARALSGHRVFPLHGSMEPERQDAALAPCDERKVVLATNIAETSLTVEGVTDVVDSGRHKVLRLDAGLGLDRLEEERIPLDAADQRAGRAGRTAPGHVLRLWDRRDVLRAHREAEIHRVDLAGPLLDVLAWGEDPRAFEWFEAPDRERLETALTLLEQLGAVRDRSITDLGRALSALPLHPRLARVLIASDEREAVLACAALAEGWLPLDGSVATDCDLLPVVDRFREAPRRVRDAARQLERRRESSGEGLPLCRALLAGYPDRVAKRRAAGSKRLLLAGGHGAELDRESGVREGEFLVALELRAAPHGSTAPTRVRVAARIEADWLAPTSRQVRHELDPDSGRVRAFETTMHHALPLAEGTVAVDPETAAEMLRDAMLERGVGESFLTRCRFAGVEIDLPALLLALCQGRQGWFEPDLLAGMDWPSRQRLERLAPARLELPSGRSTDLDYRPDGSVVAAAKLQELFGLAESPTLGPEQRPVTFELLAPNGRPVQTTQDLKSFWNTTYAEVRRELRGRYPKHPWPDDPWNAEPTARTKRRR